MITYCIAILAYCCPNLFHYSDNIGVFHGAPSGSPAASRSSSSDEIRTRRPPVGAVRITPALIRRRTDFSLIRSFAATSPMVSRTGAGRGSGGSVQTGATGKPAHAAGCGSGRLSASSNTGRPVSNRERARDNSRRAAKQSWRRVAGLEMARKVPRRCGQKRSRSVEQAEMVQLVGRSTVTEPYIPRTAGNSPMVFAGRDRSVSATRFLAVKKPAPDSRDQAGTIHPSLRRHRPRVYLAPGWRPLEVGR